jgi:hypothetical protein
MMPIIRAWIFVASVMRAIVWVPFGAVLFGIAGIITWHAERNPLWLLLAGWIAYKGGQYFFGALAAFVGRQTNREPDMRAALRRSGMLGRR